MSDNMSKEQRSYTMSRIRSRGNETTEERLAKLFRTYGIKGWRRHVDLPGKPDFIFRKEKVAVFVDGCFWHGCPRCKLKPKTNTEYWTKKIQGNRRRDRIKRGYLEAKGWAVVRIWEHALRQPRRIAKAIEDVLKGRRKNEETVPSVSVVESWNGMAVHPDDSVESVMVNKQKEEPL